MPRRMARPFDYHKPDGEQIDRIEWLREAYQDCYEKLLFLTREGSVSGRYLSMAISDLETSAMLATKAVVFEGDNEDAEGRREEVPLHPEGGGEGQVLRQEDG